MRSNQSNLGRLPFAAVLGVILPGIFIVACRDGREPDPAASPDPTRWFKGNTHTHTLWSDGNDFPEMVADWYRSEGYNFLVLSDHNVLSRHGLPVAIRERHARAYGLDPGFRGEGFELWLGESQIEGRQKALGHGALAKYLQRFGESWVDSEGQPGARSVRLKTLDEIRPEFDDPGKFLLIEGEEITVGGKQANGRPLSVHLNALNVAEPIEPVGAATTLETLELNYAAVEADGVASGQSVLAHLNHPNFQWGVSAGDLAAATTGKFYEVYNGHPGVNHLGDDARPGVERIWDIANTLRLTVHHAAPLYGVATDDAHHYHGGPVSPGRGWVMVRSTSLDPEAILQAMHRGEFYASSGVTLKAIEFDPISRSLTVEVESAEASADGPAYTIEFIGTRKGIDFDAPLTPAPGDDTYEDRPGYPDSIGTVFASSEGPEATYQLTGDELYVRARVTSTRAHPNPSFDGQLEQAWTQPVGWEVD